jgi:heme exporter protein B
VMRKDLVLEWRSRSRLISVILFGVVTLLLFSFAVGPDSSALRGGAAGFLVLALLLSSTLGLSESFRLEQEEREASSFVCWRSGCWRPLDWRRPVPSMPR